MIKPKVSIIMPVYNTAEYLEEAVESVLNQTIEDVEFIIINDGSSDGSLDILKKFSGRDNRIILIDKKNEGSSIARSIGLSKASGDFIYFMDSDDLLESDALEKCYLKANEFNLDLILFDAISFNDESLFDASTFNYVKKGLFPETIMSGPDMAYKLLVKGLFRVPPWIHFIKRELIVDNKMDFYPGIVNEDELFFTRVYFFAQRCLYLPEIFFKRRLRPNSTMTSEFSPKRSRSYFVIIDQLNRDDFTDRPLLKKIRKILIGNIVNGVAYQSSSLLFKERMNVVLGFARRGLLHLISIKNLLVLFFPFLLSLKARFRKIIFAGFCGKGNIY